MAQDPRTILQREEARARRDLAAARARLEDRALGALDPTPLVLRHPILSLLGAAATGYLAAAPLRAAVGSARRHAGALGSGAGHLTRVLARSVASAVVARGLGGLDGG